MGDRNREDQVLGFSFSFLLFCNPIGLMGVSSGSGVFLKRLRSQVKCMGLSGVSYY